MLGKLKPYIGNLRTTVYFNFKFLPFRQAIKLPIIVSNKVIIDGKSKGKVFIPDNSGWGTIKIGFKSLNTCDKRFCRSVIKIDGNLQIKGYTWIGQGAKIDIKQGGKLILGDGFNSTGTMEIICSEEISFDSDCLISWDTLFMDTDSHTITNENGEIINHNSGIHIGRHVWIGCRAVVLKGAAICDNSVIACNALITKKCNEKNVIVGGQDGKLLKRNIEWDIGKIN